MKIICAKCEIEYRTVKVGNPVVEMFLSPPEPYKILAGDRMECPSCKNQIIAGISTAGPEHFQADFQEKLEQIRKEFGNLVVKCYELRYLSSQKQSRT